MVTLKKINFIKQSSQLAYDCTFIFFLLLLSVMTVISLNSMGMLPYFPKLIIFKRKKLSMSFLVFEYCMTEYPSTNSC